MYSSWCLLETWDFKDASTTASNLGNEERGSTLQPIWILSAIGLWRWNQNGIRNYSLCSFSLFGSFDLHVTVAPGAPSFAKESGSEEKSRKLPNSVFFFVPHKKIGSPFPVDLNTNKPVVTLVTKLLVTKRPCGDLDVKRTGEGACMCILPPSKFQIWTDVNLGQLSF